MKTLEMISWKKGLKTISLITALRDCSGLSLGRAKQEVERLLDGGVVKIEFDSEAALATFREKAEEYGAICSD